MVRLKKEAIIVFFIIASLLMSLIFALTVKGFSLLEKKNIFEPSLLFCFTDTLSLELLKAIPSVIFINLGFCGMRFYREHLKQEKIKHEFQLKFLQEQITPHFMFNVLNHINTLMQEDVNLASTLLIRYSDILRYQLYNGRKELISLNQEMEFLKNFIEIEKVRWEDKLVVSCSWKIDDNEKEIPPLLFVNLIENAFKHVSRTSSEKGFITITFEQHKNELELMVINSKSIIHSQKNECSGLGLENTAERLDILYPGKYKLFKEETGTTYIVKLNIIALT